MLLIFYLPHYTLIGLVLIPLLFQDSILVILTMGGSLGHKCLLFNHCFQLELFHFMGVIRQLDYIVKYLLFQYSF